MMSAWKLFHNRRTRFGNRNDTVDDIGLDSSPTDGNSYHRTTTDRHRHHLYNSHNSRRDHRHDLDGCNHPPRRIHRHRLLEHELVQQEQVGNQSPSGSIIDSEDFRSIRRWGATGSDRLPGVVLLARERLLERLRGVHVSENRSSSSSSIPEDDFLFRGNSSIIGPNNDLPEEPISESWQAVMPMPSMTREHPPGLPQDLLNCLPVKVFNSTEDNNESPSASRECSICLEGFQDGDELIHLPCMHRFHSCCLFPWVEVCGACPNCRKAIAVPRDKLVS